MKTRTACALILSLAPALVVSANVAPVIAPAKRTQALGAAHDLLRTRDIAVPADAANPFYSAAFAATQSGAPALEAAPSAGAAPATARPAGARSGRELLTAIADGLRPSGYIVMGGQASLSFGQKRVKAGETLTIIFEGAEYTLDVVSIDRTHFTVRLHNEVYTRPIK